MVVNLVHPTPAPLGMEVPADLPPGPLTDQFDLHRELTALVADEAREMNTLRTLADDAALVEVPLLDDVQDLAGLAVLGGHLLSTAG